MALKKQLEFNNGIIAEYWRIREVKLVNGASQVIAILELWKDQETRAITGKTFVMEYSFEVNVSLVENVIDGAYEQLKLLEQFIGSIDV